MRRRLRVRHLLGGREGGETITCTQARSQMAALRSSLISHNNVAILALLPILSTLRSFTARSAGAPSRFRKQSWSPQGASRLGRAQTRRLAEHTKDRGAVDRTNYT